jgi:pimeloyl-ACP methyl ester carboxylesterase
VPTYATGTATQQTDGWAFFTSNVLVHRPDWSNGSGRPGILACHGGNQTAFSSFSPGDGSTWGDYTRALADYGFVIVACDLGQLVNGNNLALSAMDQAYTLLTSITGATTVGIMGSSAGGLTTLNYLHKRPERITGAFLIEPFIDIDTSRGTSDWVTPYTVQPGDPNAGITYAAGDPTASNGAYLCTDDTGFHTNAIDQKHTPARYPADFAGMNIHVRHAWMDPTIPYQASQWWVGAVNSPTVTFTATTLATAQHLPNTMLAGDDAATVAAGGLPRSELRDFFYSVL